MKKSRSVPATFVAGLAAAMLAGCSQREAEQRACVDMQGNILPDIMCRQATASGTVVGHWGYPTSHLGGGGYAGGGASYRGGGGGITSGTGSVGSSVARGGFGGTGEGFGAGG